MAADDRTARLSGRPAVLPFPDGADAPRKDTESHDPLDSVLAQLREHRHEIGLLKDQIDRLEYRLHDEAKTMRGYKARVSETVKRVIAERERMETIAAQVKAMLQQVLGR